VATPTITPAGGTFSGSVKVTLACATSGAIIHYTTDGSTPTSSSPTYIAPFTLTSSVTVNAKASVTGDTDSAVATASFTIIPLAITGIAGGPLQPPSSGIFEFEIHSSRAQETVQTSDDLVNWADAGTVSILNSTGFFVDGSAGANAKHFYRLKP
jgi:hypothetical protein